MFLLKDYPFFLHAFLSYVKSNLEYLKIPKIVGFPGIKTNPKKIKLKKIKSTNNARIYCNKYRMRSFR